MSKGETEIFSASRDSDHLGRRLVAQQSERRRRAHHWGKTNKAILQTWDPDSWISRLTSWDLITRLPNTGNIRVPDHSCGNPGSKRTLFHFRFVNK